MSYTCYATGQHVQGIKSNMVATKLRRVNYNNYVTYQKGDKIIKQFVGCTGGFEIAEEKPVSITAYDNFIINHKPEIVGEKTVTHEYANRQISREAYGKAEFAGKIIINNDLPIQKEEPSSDYSNYYSEDSEDRD